MPARVYATHFSVAKHQSLRICSIPNQEYLMTTFLMNVCKVLMQELLGDLQLKDQSSTLT